MRDDWDGRARREVEGRQVEEDGGRRRSRRRVQQTFLLPSECDRPGEEGQSESDPGEQRYQQAVRGLC